MQNIKTEAVEEVKDVSISAVVKLAVEVSIEPNHECEIIEVKYDGQEIYKE